MARFVLQRSLSVVLVLFTISILTFLLFQAIPNGDPAQRLAGRLATPQQVQDVRIKWGFDKPIYVQYFKTMKLVLTGKVISYTQQLNVMDQIKQGLPATLSLAIGAAIIWLGFGVLFGVIAALSAGRWLDRTLTVMSLIGVSTPVFLIGAILLYVFSYKLNWFPLGGYVKLTTSPWGWFKHMILPWIALSVLFIGVYSRILRSTILDTINEDYVRAARAKGISERRVMIRHVLRNSMIPIVSLFGLDFAAVLGGGAILTESVFNLQGVGQYAADSIGRLDVPPVLVITLLGAACVVIIAAIVDVIYALLDPRIPSVTDMPAAAPDTGAETLLTVEHLRVSFRTEDGVVKAVDDVSFEVRRGEVVAIVGESGSGKSVTAMTLMGLTRSPNARFEGTARLGDVELVSATDAQLRKVRGAEIAMVFQDPISSLDPVYRIGDQLVEQIREHYPEMSKDAAMDRATELMTRVGIPHARERLRSFPHEFSGGMRQRVMIAMALSCDPRLLIADEPTTALDVTIQAQILAELDELRRRTGTGIVFVTHDLGVVADIADRILVMYGGRIVEQGTVDELFYNPQHPYTWGLLGSIPRIDGDTAARLPAIGGHPPSLLAPPAGCHFRPRCPHAFDRCTEVPELIQRLPEAPDQLDRCWLSPAEKRELREVDGRIGLGVPEVTAT